MKDNGSIINRLKNTQEIMETKLKNMDFKSSTTQMQLAYIFFICGKFKIVRICI